MTVHLPVVYRFSGLEETLDYLFENEHLCTLLIFCSTREAFLQQLIGPTKKESREADTHQAGNDVRDAQTSAREPITRGEFSTRTMRRIAKAKAIKIAFCTSVPALHAYLSTLPQTSSPHVQHENPERKTRPPLLMLVNPISLHKETASYSAQGLSRAFAGAVEAALRDFQQLVIVEYVTRKSRSVRMREAGGHPHEDYARTDLVQEGCHQAEVADGENEAEEQDPWEQEVPILNATTRTFGNGSLTSVLGRTVKVKAVAERWCTFESVTDEI